MENPNYPANLEKSQFHAWSCETKPTFKNRDFWKRKQNDNSMGSNKTKYLISSLHLNGNWRIMFMSHTA